MKLATKLMTMMAAVVLIGPAAEANRESGGRLAASAVYVDYRSIGSGIDLATYNLAEELIDEARQAGDVVDEIRIQRGREGEVLRCVEFADAANRLQFIRAIAPSILEDEVQLGQRRTSVRTGFTCDSYEEATEQDLEAYLR